LAAIITQGLVELDLAWRRTREIQLSAETIRRLEKRHRVFEARGFGRAGHAGGPAADDGNAVRFVRRIVVKFRLPAGAGIDQAGGDVPGEDVIQAGLIACNTGVYVIGPAFPRLQGEVGIGQHGAGHGHQIRIAAGNDVFRQFRCVDPV